MRPLGRIAVAGLGVLLSLCLCRWTAEAAAPLKYTPQAYKAQLQPGDSVAFSLKVESPKDQVTATLPTVDPDGSNGIPAAWVSAVPGQATFAKEGAVFTISISVPPSSAPGSYKSHVGAHVTQGNASDGSGCAVRIDVNSPPTAAFTYSPLDPTDVDTVSFTDASTDPDGTVVAWQWDFGDGTTSAEQHPSHRFAASPYNLVGLTVTDDDGDVAYFSAAVQVRAATGSEPAVLGIEPLTLLYTSSRVVAAGAALRLSASATDILGEDPGARIGALISFIVVSDDGRFVAETYTGQADSSTPGCAEVNVGPGVYRVFVYFSGNDRFAPAGAGPELAVVLPAGEGARAVWGALGDSAQQFALLVPSDAGRQDSPSQFLYLDAAEGTELASTAVDRVTFAEGALRITGICSANGVNGYGFRLDLTQADGAWVFTLEVSNGLFVQAVLPALSDSGLL